MVRVAAEPIVAEEFQQPAASLLRNEEHGVRIGFAIFSPSPNTYHFVIVRGGQRLGYGFSSGVWPLATRLLRCPAIITPLSGVRASAEMAR